MESEEQLELTQKALKHLVEEENKRTSEIAPSHHLQTSLKLGDHSHPLLPNLLSQQDDSMNYNDMVEELNESANSRQLHPPESSRKNETTTGEAADEDEIMIDNKEIMKELREIKKQNRKTHWLLSTLIVLTLTWQLSEVSLILKLKEGITNPFKSVGTMFKEILSKRSRILDVHVEKNDAAEQKQDSSSILPPWP